MQSILLVFIAYIISTYSDCTTADEHNCVTQQHSTNQLFGWCGFCNLTNECINIQEYCNNKSLCTPESNFEWNRNNPYDNCHQAKLMQAFLLTFIGLIFGLIYCCCFLSIIKQTIIKITICTICFITYTTFITISAINSWNNHHWKMLYLWTLGSGLAFLSIFISLILLFKLILIPSFTMAAKSASRSMQASMHIARKSVSAQIRMSIYIVYILLLLSIFIITIYQVFSHQYIIGILPWLSLIVLTLDLIHPVDKIQTKSSRRLLASKCNDSSSPLDIKPLELQPSHSVETRNCEEFDCDEEYEYKYIQQESEHSYGAVLNADDEFEQNNAEHSMEVDVKYWQLIAFVIYVGSLVGFGFAYHEYESCLFSWATVLPTLMNVYFFYQRGKEMRNVLKFVYWCSLISCGTIVMILIVFSSLSCSCYGFSQAEQTNHTNDENEEDMNDCQWFHVLVIVIVGLFAVVDIYHKKNCLLK